MVKLFVRNRPFSAGEATLRDRSAQHGVRGGAFKANAAVDRPRGRVESISKRRGR